MKKLLYIALFFTLSIYKYNHLFAQSFYILGGTNLSKLDISKGEQNAQIKRNPLFGFHIGSSVDIEINKRFSIIPSVLFSLKREFVESTAYLAIPITQDNNDVSILKSSSSSNKFYLDIPIPLKYNFTIWEKSFYGMAGPYVSLLLFNSNSIKFYENGELIDLGEPIGGKFSNRIDYGFNLGFGAEIKRYLFQVSYDHGLYRKMKFEENGLAFNTIGRNAVIRFSLGYKL